VAILSVNRSEIRPNVSRPARPLEVKLGSGQIRSLRVPSHGALIPAIETKPAFTKAYQASSHRLTFLCAANLKQMEYARVVSCNVGKRIRNQLHEPDHRTAKIMLPREKDDAAKYRDQG